MSVRRYAERTHVPVERTLAEIHRLLTRYGASAVALGDDGRKGGVTFRLAGRSVRMEVAMPSAAEVERLLPRAERLRTQARARHCYEQARRQRWRAFLLLLTAKLEACELHVATFDEEFFAQLLTNDGRTAYEALTSRQDIIALQLGAAS